MGVIDRVVIVPVLWVVYLILPLFSGSLSSYSSFPIPDDPLVRRTCQEPLWYVFVIICALGIPFFGWQIVVSTDMLINRVHKLGDTLAFLFQILLSSIFIALFFISLLLLLKPCIFVFLQCSIWLLRNLLCTLIKILTQSVIVAFKNRRSCQLLSVVASVLIGILVSSSASKYLAVIPLGVGFILTIPDFDLEPDVKFRLRFTRFVTCNMDEKSVEKLLDSKHCKMLCCNEMMPSLADLESPVFSCFVKREDPQYCDSPVNPKYEIGLGSVTTSSNEHQIDVVVSTPRCGIKKMTMRNTALSRYNLHKSAEFWRDNPRLGILNYGEVKTHCISTDEWIKCCGLEEYIFVASDDYDQDV